MTVLQDNMTDTATDWHSQGIHHRRRLDALLSDIMNLSQSYDQHHVKLDFALDNGKEPIYSHVDLITGEILHKYSQGVSPTLQPHHTTSGRPGVYALCHDRSKTIYVGANKYTDSTGSIHDRLSRFGRGIYDRLSPEENHSAGTKYRRIYGENTSGLYVSFVFYEQLDRAIWNEMKSLDIKLRDLEMLFIKKFSSPYLLNSIRK